MIVGVDADQTQTDPENADVYLTSVLKRMDSTVTQVIDMAMADEFEGGLTVGTLENDGVGLAGFGAFDGDVPDELKAELEAVKAGIIDGSIKVGM